MIDGSNLSIIRDFIAYIVILHFLSNKYQTVIWFLISGGFCWSQISKMTPKELTAKPKYEICFFDKWDVLRNRVMVTF